MHFSSAEESGAEAVLSFPPEVVWKAITDGEELGPSVGGGPDDRKWDAALEDTSAGYAALFVDLRRYLEGRYDAQQFPFFGIRSRPGSSGTDNAPIVTHVRPWAEAAGVRAGGPRRA